MRESKGFSIIQRRFNKSQRAQTFSQSSYKVFDARTRSRSMSCRPGMPSGNSAERRGREKGRPWLSKVGMFLAKEAVPQGGASQTKKGL